VRTWNSEKSLSPVGIQRLKLFLEVSYKYLFGCTVNTLGPDHWPPAFCGMDPLFCISFTLHWYNLNTLIFIRPLHYHHHPILLKPSLFNPHASPIFLSL
jgi:hypothetical protein